MAREGLGGGEDMGLLIHSPGPLPWSEVSEPAVDTGVYTNGQSLSWIPNFSEDDFTSESWVGKGGRASLVSCDCVCPRARHCGHVHVQCKCRATASSLLSACG